MENLSSRIPRPCKGGRPRKSEEKRRQRSSIKFLVENADRFRNFVITNNINNWDDGLVQLLLKVAFASASSTQFEISGRSKVVTKLSVCPTTAHNPHHSEDVDKWDFEDTDEDPSLIIDADTIIDTDIEKTRDEFDLTGFSIYELDEDEESVCYESTDKLLKTRETKREHNKTAQEVLKNLAKCTDLDYSASRRLLDEGYHSAFSIKATKELESVCHRRFIVEEDLLWLLLGNKCKIPDCNEKILTSSCEYKVVGCVYVMNWMCSIGHKGSWESGQKLVHRNNKKLSFYATNVLFASSCLFSGNQWTKIMLFAKALNLQIISQPLYHRIQKNLCFPVIDECWSIMQTKMFEKAKFLNQPLIVCGDCQNDSPGNSSEFGVYTFVDHECGYVLDLEVVEKRYTDLKSPNMEKVGFIRSICRLLQQNVPISEIVTDQNLQIIGLFKKANKGDSPVLEDARAALYRYPDIEYVPLEQLIRLKDICHQLDIWHKAKNIGKMILEIANKCPKNEKLEQKKLIALVPDIKNHFWYCSETCKGDVKLFIENWMNCLKHVTGVHEWAVGRCKHASADVDVDTKETLNASSKTFDMLRSAVIGSPRLLESLHYFRKFRHTGQLESFHNMTLMYTPKRIVFDFDTMVARKKLASIDNNHHIHRQIIRDDGGVPRVTRRWSKRANEWIIQFRKERKNYSYLNDMQACVLHLRCTSQSMNLNPAERSQLHPSRIAPNTGKFQKTIDEILSEYESRYL